MLFHLDLMILPWLFDEGLLCQKYTDQGTQIGMKIPPIKRHLLPIAMSLWHKGTYNIVCTCTVLYSVLKSTCSYNSPSRDSPGLLGHSRMYSVYSTVCTVQCVQYYVYRDSPGLLGHSHRKHHTTLTAYTSTLSCVTILLMRQRFPRL